MAGLLDSGASKNCLSKSSGLKCFEQTTDVFDRVKFARFCSTKFTHLFRRFFASGLSSSAKGMLWTGIPSLVLGTLEHPNTTHRFGMLVAQFLSSQPNIFT
jgi:hypothetical protein